MQQNFCPAGPATGMTHMHLHMPLKRLKLGSFPELLNLSGGRSESIIFLLVADFTMYEVLQTFTTLNLFSFPDSFHYYFQTLTPHMQSVAAKEIDENNGSGSTKSYSRTSSSSGDQEQGSFSLDLWKKAFGDSFERLCPVRAGGHECGCLPMLARLVN